MHLNLQNKPKCLELVCWMLRDANSDSLIGPKENEKKR